MSDLLVKKFSPGCGAHVPAIIHAELDVYGNEHPEPRGRFCGRDSEVQFRVVSALGSVDIVEWDHEQQVDLFFHVK